MTGLAAALVLRAVFQYPGGLERHALEYAPAPAANPLRGLVPYAGDHRDRFPHSMEFNYLPLASLVVGEAKYDWRPLDDLLSSVAGRGHQAVFRVYIEYPGRKSGVPRYLLAAGLKVHRYENTNTAPFPPAQVETPDYADPRLGRCLIDFISALGRKYDGDPRVACITAGLLGTWGEWHTYPREDLWAPREVQSEVMDAYEAAFRKTHVLLRYPAGKGDPHYAPNAGRGFGYHDDSFAWATLETGRGRDEWFFMARMKRAGPQAADKWKTRFIGGEIRPEAWGIVFDENPGRREVQDFATCVERTHATWLMDTGMFRGRPPEARRRRAEERVRRMGYEMHVPAVAVAVRGGVLEAAVEVENRGVAPFYYDWPTEFALLDRAGEVEKLFAGRGRIAGILPGQPRRVWEERFDILGVRPGRYCLAVRVPNPMSGGMPVRFANKEQDRDRPGWLSLAAVELP